MERNYIFSETDSMPWQPSEMADGVEVKSLGTVNVFGPT